MSEYNEPWFIRDTDDGGFVLLDATHNPVSDSEREVKERIVLCVNMLAGFKSEDLRALLNNPMYLENAFTDFHSAIMAAKGECG